MAHMKKVFLTKLTKYEKAQCKLFADYSVETHLDEYKRRGQEDIEKIKQDIYYGKIGEMMVYNYMKQDGIKDVSPIDLNIYEHKQKSYDADFRVGAHNVHVKTHVVNNNFPASWMFQKNDPLTKDKSNTEVLFLCVLGRECYAYITLIQPDVIIFEEPMKVALRETKVCVYEETLLHLKKQKQEEHAKSKLDKQ